jgi:hypothetical protein
VFEFVNIVLSAALTQVLEQFFVVVLSPLVDTSPRVTDGRRRRETFRETLHLNLALADTLEVP